LVQLRFECQSGVKYGKVMARAQADGSGVTPAMRCRRGDGTTTNGKRRAAARPGWPPCLDGLINRVNPLCWGGGVGLLGCARREKLVLGQAGRRERKENGKGEVG
jgi:hypothetical protein